MRFQFQFGISTVVVLCSLAAKSLIASPAEEGRPDVIPTFDETGVQVGDRVESLTLHSLDGLPFKLHTAWDERPALLVLSSISCPVSRDNCAAVDRLARRYAGKINVVVIYTIEAHPVGAPAPYSDRQWLTGRSSAHGHAAAFGGESEPCRCGRNAARSQRGDQFEESRRPNAAVASARNAGK